MSDTPRSDGDDAWERLSRLPDAETEPDDQAWAHQQQPPAPAPAPTPEQDPRRIVVRPGASNPVEPEAPSSLDPGPSPVDPRPPTRVPDPAETPPPTRRRRRGRVVAAMLAIVVVMVGAMALYASVLWNRIDRADTARSLAPASEGFTNYLIVGTDSREGIDPDLDTADDIGLGVGGQRTDTMIILQLRDDGSSSMVSLPRDLWVALDTGGGAKLNAAYAFNGPPSLIRTIDQEFQIPIHRYLEVDLAGFLDVVGAVGSITIDFPRAACDPKSGLDIRTVGPVDLDEEQALAYVRSRTYTEFDAAVAEGLDCAQIRAQGLGTTQSLAPDLARGERQRRFLLATLDRAAGSRNPVTLLRVLGGVSGGLVVDDAMSFFDAVGMARKLRGLDAEVISLEVADFAAPDGSSALVVTAAGDVTLDLFRD